MKLGILFIILLVFLPFENVLAQEVPKIISFKSSDYSAGYQNWMITQDCDGYIFIANTEAVLIFNGYKWQQVDLPRKQIPRAVFLGQDCIVYTGTYESFGYIDYSDKSHPVYKSLNDSLLESTSQEIWNIFGNEDQVIFQSFSHIYKYDYRNISLIMPPGNIMLGKNLHGKLYLPKVEQGLYLMEEDHLKEIPAANRLPDKGKVADFCAVSDTSQKIILGTQHHGLFLLEETNIIPLNSELNEQLKTEQINKIIRLSSGSYAIGTILNGVYITDDFYSVKYHINKSNGLSNNTVLSLFEDQNHDLWIGLDQGIDLLKLSAPLTYFYDKQGKLGTIFTSILYKNTLYLGTNQGLFKSLNNGTFSLIKNSQGQIWSFILMGDDLICGHNNGTYLVKEDKFIQISDITGGWYMKAISNNLILQSTYTGLILLEKKNGKWSVLRRIENGNLLIEKFTLTGNRLIGFHPHYGICILTFSDNLYQVTKQIIFDKIDGQNVNAVQFLSTAQKMIISLNNTLYKFEKEGFKKLTQNEITLLTGDSDFAIQYKTQKAIQEISKSEGLFRYDISSARHAEDAIILGLEEGYLKFYPSEYPLKSSLKQIHIDHITVDGEIFKASDPMFVYPAQKEIRIQFNDFSFNKYQLPIQYKLEKWNNQWQDIPPDGNLNFIKLDDGEYNLMVRGNYETPVLLLDFYIKPHWYESWPGGLIYAVLFFSLLFYFNKRYKKKLERQTNKMQHEKDKELESERIKARNDKLRREVIYKSKMLANSTLALAQKNKMLNDLKAVMGKFDLKVISSQRFKQRILNLIDRNIKNDEEWEIFERNFAEIHEDFLEKLKFNYPNITAGELKLAAYIRMNLSSKEIAPLLNISLRSVENKRYRLRKKMGIVHENNLSDHLLRL